MTGNLFSCIRPGVLFISASDLTSGDSNQESKRCCFIVSCRRRGETMVDYRLRDELMNLRVCLFDYASGQPFTTDALQNYILDTAYQLRTGEPVRRVPFHITPSEPDAMRAIDTMKKELHNLRKESASSDSTASDRKRGISPTSWKRNINPLSQR